MSLLSFFIKSFSMKLKIIPFQFLLHHFKSCFGKFKMNVISKIETLIMMTIPFGFHLLFVIHLGCTWIVNHIVTLMFPLIIMTFMPTFVSIKTPFKSLQTISSNGAHESNSISTKWTFFYKCLTWNALNLCYKSYLVIKIIIINLSTIIRSMTFFSCHFLFQFFMLIFFFTVSLLLPFLVFMNLTFLGSIFFSCSLHLERF